MGFNGPEAFQGLGTNAKMSELHAAMGLCLFPKMHDVIAARNERVDRYNSHFDALPQVQRPSWRDGASSNAAYYPIILPTEYELHRVMEALVEINVVARRYFYPCLVALPYVPSVNLPMAEDISKRILCLPIYPDLDLETVDLISESIKKIEWSLS